MTSFGMVPVARSRVSALIVNLFLMMISPTLRGTKRTEVDDICATEERTDFFLLVLPANCIDLTSVRRICGETPRGLRQDKTRP
jgi:hypothetical protein